MKKLTLVLIMVCLAGCAGKQKSKPVPPVPLPPQASFEQQKVESKKEEHSVTKQEVADGQTLTVPVPPELSGRPQRNEPEKLAELLEMKSGLSEKETAVTLMRPAAIKEAAQLVTFQTAIEWRYKQLVAETERRSAIMDAAFNFAPLLMTQDNALIMPPVLARAGASMRIEKSDTATVADTSYELLEAARYVSAPPNWREYLMADDFPKAEKPHPAVMPKDAKERAVWRAAVREAWARGVTEADQLYADNVSRMARQYRGIMLYHLLTAQHLLSKVNTASANLGLKTSDNGGKLHIGQRVYRITAPSAFTIPGVETKKRK
jgi:hypothetical protein